jgi:transposase InsO family protein
MCGRAQRRLRFNLVRAFARFEPVNVTVPLEAQVRAFVEHYNHGRYHESLDNLTPADVYFGRGQTILLERARIKRQTIANRRLQHHAQAA